MSFILKTYVAFKKTRPRHHSWECLLHRFTSLFQPRTHRAGIGVDSICDNCIDNICFFGNDMYILSDIAHMLKIHQVRKERVLAT